MKILTSLVLAVILAACGGSPAASPTSSGVGRCQPDADCTGHGQPYTDGARNRRRVRVLGTRA